MLKISLLPSFGASHLRSEFRDGCQMSERSLFHSGGGSGVHECGLALVAGSWRVNTHSAPSDLAAFTCFMSACSRRAYSTLTPCRRSAVAARRTRPAISAVSAAIQTCGPRVFDGSNL